MLVLIFYYIILNMVLTLGDVIYPARPYFHRDDLEAILGDIRTVLESGRLTLGRYTRLLEEEFARLVGARYAVAVNSGTAALEIILRSLGIGGGDEVIVPTNTFVATVNAVIYAGAKPVLADIDRDSLCISLDEVRRRVTDRTKAVIVVHIGGTICPDIFEIRDFCESRGIYLIEDAAHAHGSSFRGSPAGSFGVAAAFSFYPTKVMTSAEGGIITTDSEEVRDKAAVLRDQGKSAFESGLITELGYNWRMSEVHAVIGLHQLHRLDEYIGYRRRLAGLYDEALGGLRNFRPQPSYDGMVRNYYKYIVFISRAVDRDRLKKMFREDYGVVLGGEVYDPPVHLQPYFRRLFNTGEGLYPVAEEVCRRHVCLPMHNHLSVDDVGKVIDALREVDGLW